MKSVFSQAGWELVYDLRAAVADGAVVLVVGDRVALAGDLRPSTPRMLSACALAVEDMGGVPVFCGYVPTPALAFYAMSEAIPAIMVTGSHIPDDRNGIKFYRPDGEILKHEEPDILAQPVHPRAWPATGMATSLPSLVAKEGIVEAYVQRYLEFFGSEALRGARIGVYQHSAVGRDILVEILEALGAEAVPLGKSEPSSLDSGCLSLGARGE